MIICDGCNKKTETYYGYYYEDDWLGELLAKKENISIQLCDKCNNRIVQAIKKEWENMRNDITVQNEN